jgi:uncharacterized RDD family membrane protein YckC
VVLYWNTDGATVIFLKAALIFVLKILYISFFYFIQFSLFQKNLRGGGVVVSDAWITSGHGLATNLGHCFLLR